MKDTAETALSGERGKAGLRGYLISIFIFQTRIAGLTVLKHHATAAALKYAIFQQDQLSLLCLLTEVIINNILN